ncbi:hypothetical protein [Segetibacter sp.]|jgi:hypothetical protein|uniref:hypothetical protein n=1 Tax=Segetibacter sp. TaxID=2231182 RepID=UPI0026386293|nr:hypothetical protein [Segetibacter sp.]MCW3081310.1 hypothetical protein [Segetibacter sp.]
MAKSLSVQEISEAVIIEKVFVLRGVKVMLDRDLAEMGGIKVLNQAVKKKHHKIFRRFYL